IKIILPKKGNLNIFINNFSNLLFFVSVIGFVFLFKGCGENNRDKIKLKNDSSVVKFEIDEDETEVDSIIIIGVGDIMMGSNYPVKSLPPDDGANLFSEVSEYLSDADVTFGNLEGPLLTKGGTPKQCGPESHCVAFRMPEHYAAYLKEAGFDIVSIANNHANDMGSEGRKSTKYTLEKYDIGYAGQTDCPVYKFEKNGVKYGFTTFSPSINTCNINDIDKAVEIVGDLKKEVDIVIVSFHGGGEGTAFQHVTGNKEYFLSETRGNVFEFSHSVINAGADIVFGHGPHVPRAIEMYKGKFIAYSLGNFCTYAKFGLYGVLGIAPIIKVWIDNKGNFLKGKIIPIKQIKKGIPVYDENESVIRTIRNLTKQDFPDTDIIIDDNGVITNSK
ncbi:MAG TPA: CapA family protein, partial [Ignavibacteria bacterium]